MCQLLWREGGRAEQLETAFYREQAWADRADYLEGVAATRGGDVKAQMLADMERIVKSWNASSNFPTDFAVDTYAPGALLLTMPEPDFLIAVEHGIREFGAPLAMDDLAIKINRACALRGVPYRVEGRGSQATFEWIGDAITETQVLKPAHSALDDRRLAGGPSSEFASARKQLREGTDAARKLAVGEACSAVESGLKVLLTEHGRELPESRTLDGLIAACREARIFPAAVDGGIPVEQILAAPGRFGNRRGRHGSGAVPHDVQPDEAEAVVAAAAVALTLIARRLP